MNYVKVLHASGGNGDLIRCLCIQYCNVNQVVINCVCVKDGLMQPGDELHSISTQQVTGMSLLRFFKRLCNKHTTLRFLRKTHKRRHCATQSFRSFSRKRFRRQEKVLDAVENRLWKQFAFRLGLN